MRHRVARRLLGASVVASAALTLSACGGGGGGGGIGSTPPPPVPTPSPTPVPAPSPTPTPAPTSTFATAEFNRSSGLGLHGAITAYTAGATGRGVVAGVVDSGIDTNSAEFAGRVHPASADLAGSRGLSDEAGHGTAVSSVLLGAKNDSGTHGVAFDATLLVLKTDTPGSCTDPGSGDDEGGCSHADNNIAEALDLAVAQNARVVNISLGGSPMNSTLRAALGRATAAGVVIVISAGNDGEEPEGANPDPFAMVALDTIARGQVIIAGSIGATQQISSFSNRAGAGAQAYLAALGDNVRAPDETGAAFLWDGTSFAAPHIAGAVALLAQAFPNLTGAQIVDLLLTTARDLGAPGTDNIYGRGMLDLARAFQPQGQSSLAGSKAAVSMANNGNLSAAMGDGGKQGGLGAVILDGYSRAFAVDLARSIAVARPSLKLTASLQSRQRNLAAASGGAMVALSIAPQREGVAVERLLLSGQQAEQARALAGFVSTKLGKRTQVAFGIAQSGRSLAATLEGRRDPAFLIAREPGQATGFERRSDTAFALRHQMGRLGLTVTAENGDALVYEPSAADAGRGRYRPYRFSALGASLDRRFGAVSVEAGVSRLIEDETVLGARLGPALGGGAGARSWFADLGVSADLGRGWGLGASTRQGWTRAIAGGALTEGGSFRTDAYSLDVAKLGLFDASDQLAFRIAQPLRVRSGGLDLTLPTSYDYWTGVTGYTTQRLNLAPVGREIDVEASYVRDLWAGRIGGNIFYRSDPGNHAYAPDDLGAAVSYSFEF